MVKILKYKVGDKVFAKVKGYPPWPAKVVGEQNANTKNRKLNVVFYGTKEIGAIKPEDLFYYLKYKDTIVQKYTKKAGYLDAVKQIEEAVKKDGGDGNDGNASEDSSIQDIEVSDSSVTSSASEKKAPKRKVTSLPAGEPAAKKAAGRGRRSAAAAADLKNTEDSGTEEVAPKRGRRKSNLTNVSDERSEESDSAKKGNESDVPGETKEKESIEEEKEESAKKINDNGVIKESSKKTEPVTEKEEGETRKKETETTESESEVETKKPSEEKMEDTTTASETENLSKEDKNSTNEGETSNEKPKESIEGNNDDAGGSNKDETTSDESPVAVKVEIVTKHLLQNNIQYAEHVKKNVDLYKNKPVEKRHCTQDDTLNVKLPSGKICGIKIHKEWPLNHENEYERALYDEKTAKLALEIRDLLSTGKKTPKQIEELEVIPNIKMSPEDLKEITYAKDVESKTRRLDRLKKEADLVTWDSTIKNNLGLDKALPDVALKDLKAFKTFEKDLDSLMFKKHPHVLDTIRRLRKYVGNIKEWSMTEKDLEHFTKMAEKIRNEAEWIYNQIKAIIPLPEEKGSFWDGFMDLVSEFRIRCKDLSESEVLVLCAEPDSRQSFLDKIDELIDPEEANVGASNPSEPVLKETCVKGWADKK
ncbi:PC4 and SFRS1-interacting protein [Anthonomus grandis grandis]|uniref:PC4 and SFRS1-interacting protein n=1 Tax=Anthonomus grandis grandis TaxID=2921223 RepID=UPI002165EB84|nr:PC4 and SFRS1-interacting protein [Anthonomus grandis grandis]